MHLEALGLQRLHVGRGQAVQDHVELTVLEVELLGRDVGLDRDVDLPHVRLRAPVAVERREHVLLAGHERRDRVRAGARVVRLEPRLRVVGAGVRRDLRRAVDLRAVRRGEVVEERAHRVLQLHDERQRVRRLVRRDVGEHVRGRRVHLGAALEALLDRGRVHRGAVVELHVRPQRERVGLAVGRDRPLRRERAARTC